MRRLAPVGWFHTCIDTYFCRAAAQPVSDSHPSRKALRKETIFFSLPRQMCFQHRGKAPACALARAVGLGDLPTDLPLRSPTFTTDKVARVSRDPCEVVSPPEKEATDLSAGLRRRKRARTAAEPTKTRPRPGMSNPQRRSARIASTGQHWLQI